MPSRMGVSGHVLRGSGQRRVTLRHTPARRGLGLDADLRPVRQMQARRQLDGVIHDDGSDAHAREDA